MVVHRTGECVMLFTLFSLFRNKTWLLYLIGVLGLIAIIGIQTYRVCLWEKDYAELKLVNEVLTQNITALKGQVDAAKEQTDFKESELSNVNELLSKCWKAQQEQNADFNEIKSIMEENSEPVEEVKTYEPITTTQQIKGIDFVNQQFDKVK